MRPELLPFCHELLRPLHQVVVRSDQYLEQTRLVLADLLGNY